MAKKSVSAGSLGMTVLCESPPIEYNEPTRLSQPGRTTPGDRKGSADGEPAHPAVRLARGPQGPAWSRSAAGTCRSSTPGIIDEHKAVRTAAGLFDVSHMGRLSFAGAEALDLIQKVWTNNAATMKDFQVRYGLVCKEDGGTLDDVLVYRWPYGWAMVVNASNREKIVGWLNRHKAGAGRADPGPDARHGDDRGPGAEGGRRCAPGCSRPTRPSSSTTSPPRRGTRGRGCVVSRTGYTGEDGFEIMVSKAQAVELADDSSSRGAVPCGLGARDTLRLEAAMPLYGHELTEAIDPIQAGLGWAVKAGQGRVHRPRRRWRSPAKPARSASGWS